jgi:hypothetical protein
VNSEERPPSRIARIIDGLLGIADAIGITGLVLQVGSSAQGKGTQLLVTTRTGSLSWTTPSAGKEQAGNEEGRTRPDAGPRPPGRACP